MISLGVVGLGLGLGLELAVSEREARGSGSREEMLPKLAVSVRASDAGSEEGRLLFVLRVSIFVAVRWTFRVLTLVNS